MTLNLADRNYSNIHRETLAIIFGLQNCYKYLIRNHYIIQSDHKPHTKKSEIPPLVALRLTRMPFH